MGGAEAQGQLCFRCHEQVSANARFAESEKVCAFFVSMVIQVKKASRGNAQS